MTRPKVSKVGECKTAIANQIREILAATGHTATASGGQPLECLPLSRLVGMRDVLLAQTNITEPRPQWQQFSREGSLMSV